MKTLVELNNVSLKFKLYNTNQIGLKEYFINTLIKRNKINNYEEFWVLNSIDLNFKDGERVGIIGNNGAGKSTLLKLIAGIYYPTIGEIKTYGKIAPLIELGAGFNQEFSGRENIYLNGAVLGYSKKQMQQLEKNIIEFSELDNFIDVPVKYYSTGMYMRLAFTIATEIKPEILIIDELFAGGDINFVEKAKKRMYDLIDNSQLMIMVSHSMGLIENLCNRVIVIHDHKVVFDGLPKEGIEFYKLLNQINN